MMRQIRALVIENTFTSLPELVPHALPFLGPVSFLCHQKWNSASKIPLIPATTPILMLSGARDEIVPKQHMRTLWEAVAKRGEKKTQGGMEFKVGLERAKFMEFEFGGHSQYFQFFLMSATPYRCSPWSPRRYVRANGLLARSCGLCC